MTFIDLPAARRAAGSVRLPGSKSISNRLLLLAAVARGTTELLGLLEADDTRVMIDALRQLGVGFEGSSVQGFTVHGIGGTFPVKQADLFLGNAGTAFRPLTAALALAGGEYRLHGVARMHERPIPCARSARRSTMKPTTDIHRSAFTRPASRWATRCVSVAMSRLSS